MKNKTKTKLKTIHISDSFNFPYRTQYQFHVFLDKKHDFYVDWEVEFRKKSNDNPHCFIYLN